MLPFVSLDSSSISVEDALRRDRLVGDTVLKRAEEELLVRRYAEQNGISNSDEELQVAFDEMRYLRGLESADETKEWLRSTSQSLQSIQAFLNASLLRNKVINSFSDDAVRAYFAENKLDLDQVELYSIRVESEDVAEELYAQVVDEGENFHLLAMEHSEDEASASKGGYVGSLTRKGMTGEIEAAVFAASEGEVVGPMKTDRGWNLFKVRALREATLEDQEITIRNALFQELLDRLRKESSLRYPALEADDSSAA